MANWDNTSGNEYEEQASGSDPESNSSQEETFQSAQTVPNTEPLSPQQLDHQEAGDVVEDNDEEATGEEEEDILPPIPIPADPDGGSSDEYIPSSPLAPAAATVEPESVQKRARRKSKLTSTDHVPTTTDPTPHAPSYAATPIPASTHLSRTQTLRDTMATLNAERAGDLSGNLFVAFMIRKDARQRVGQQRSQQRKGESRSRSRLRSEKKRAIRSMSLDASEQEDEAISLELQGGRRGKEEKPFTLPKTWTAWPMPPNQVPRDFHTDPILDLEDPFTFTQDWESRWGRTFDRRNKGFSMARARLKSREELEGWIIASITRVGRERWHAREWEGEGESGDETSSGSNEASGFEKAQLHPKDRHDSSSSSSSPEPEPQMFSSQPILKHTPAQSQPSAHFASDSDSDLSASPSPLSQGGLPIPLADDGVARTLLLPATRRIVAQLDKLLLGLHRMRWAQAYSNSKGRGRKRKRGGRTETEDETGAEEGSRSRSKRGKSKRKGSAKRGRKSSLVHDDEIKAETDPEPRSRSEFLSTDTERNSSSRHNANSHRSHHLPSSSSRERQRLSKLGLRDWSDVLGTAAVVDWDRDVLARAGERCARLFGEGMGFRTFVDPMSMGQGGRGVGGGEKGGGKVEEWGVCPGGVWGGEEGKEEENNDDEDGVDDSDRFMGDVEGVSSIGDEEEEEE